MNKQAAVISYASASTSNLDIICESGEFESPYKLQDFVRLLCGFPGNYEVQVSSQDGEEAVMHCGENTIRNAMWREVAGVDALVMIFSWPKVRFRIEPLSVLPPRTIDLPLDSVLIMVNRRNLLYNSPLPA